MSGTVVNIPQGLHPSWRSVDMAGWRWPHFSPRELACKCGGRFCEGEYFHNPEFLDALEILRSAVGQPMVVTSGRRCATHHARVSTATLSQHKLAIAVDISLMGHDPVEMARLAVRAGFRGIGFGSSFLHLDWRETRTAFHYPDGARRWTARFGFDPVLQLRRRWML